MSDTDFKIGAILVNSLRQYTKVISFKRGVYGLSGWTTRDNAVKATVAHKFVNSHGLRLAGVRVAESGAKSANAPAKASASKSDSNKRQAAPKKAATKKATAKKSAKTTSKKSGSKGK